jgi:hypothetical protein
VGVIDIGRKSAPDCWLHRQEAPTRILATPAAFLHIFANLLQK